jgi:choline dehydrogenase-like flavoprotein
LNAKEKFKSSVLKKEIVLSAGSVNNPQLLMLNGIGPAQHFKELNIPVIADLGVGNNLQDHIAAGGMVFTLEQPVSMVQSRFEKLPSILRYAMFDLGPLTVPGGVEGLAWVNTKYANCSVDWPDIEFHFMSGTPAADGGVQIRRVHGLVLG